jgi:hypothetical protein
MVLLLDFTTLVTGTTKLTHGEYMTTQNTKWTITVEEAGDGSGDLVLPLPQDMLDLQGWKEGDTLLWKDEGNGSWSLTKDKND